MAEVTIAIGPAAVGTADTILRRVGRLVLLSVTSTGFDARSRGVQDLTRARQRLRLVRSWR